MRPLMLLAVVVLLSACATTPQRIPRMSFPENVYQSLPKTGSGTVKGQAFLKTRGGDVKTAAGSQVILNPVTSYSLEWYEKFYLQGIRLAPSDPRMESYLKIQVADGDGRFNFKNVPPGEYFVTVMITWEAATGYRGSLQRQGGGIVKRIKIKDGEEIDVIA